MKLRILQVAFVALFLSLAGWIVRQGRPHLLPATQAQDAPRFRLPETGFAPVSPEIGSAASTAVTQQLEAFQRGDFRTAAQYQSTDLQNHIGSPAQFRMMMEEQYPEFLQIRSFTINQPRSPDHGDHVAVPILLHTFDHHKISALYIMVHEPDGYKVQGVMPVMPILDPIPGHHLDPRQARPAPLPST